MPSCEPVIEKNERKGTQEKFAICILISGFTDIKQQTISILRKLYGCTV